MFELLAALGGIGLRPAKNHEAADFMRKGAAFPLGVILFGVRLLLLPFLGAASQELLHEPGVFVCVLDRVGVVQAWPLEHFLKVVRGALGGRSLSLSLDSGHERALAPWLAFLLLFLLARVVGGTLIGVLVLLHLAFGAIKDCPHRVLAGSVASGDVKELLGSS
jgi:hypothetical protein